MEQTNISSFFKLVTLLRPQKNEIYSIYLYSIVSGLVALSLPLGIQSIIGYVMGGAISVSLVLLISFVIAGVFVSGLLKVNQMKVIERVQQKLFTSYGFKYANTIPKLKMSQANKYSLPNLSNHFFDVISLQKSISKLLLDIPAATIQIIFGLILLSFYHPFFISFGIFLLIFLFVIIRYTGNKGLHTSLEVSENKYKVINYIQELSRTIFNLKFMKQRGWTITHADNILFKYIKSRTAHFKVLVFQYWTLIAFKVIIVSSMLIVGSYLLINQQLNIGQFIATEIVIMSIVESIEKLIVNLDKVYDTLTSIEKIDKLFKIEKEPKGVILNEIIEAPSIRIRDLSYSYKNEEKVLDNINLDILSGEKVAIVGNTGSGKSTLLKLISGLYEIDTGNIFINNIPIGNYDLTVYRRLISVMLSSQDIFEGTIRDNICLGSLGITEEQLYKYADITGLRTFVDKSKNGFEHWIIPMSNHLPETIIKKIILTRALIHNSPLLLLENPWQGIDMIYANRVKEYLLNELNNTTVIVVTNDDFFVDRCTKKIILDKGKQK